MSIDIEKSNQQKNNEQQIETYHLLQKIQEKLKPLLVKISQNILDKKSSFEPRQVQLKNKKQQTEQNKVKLKQKAGQVLCQIQVFEIILAENNFQKSTFQRKMQKCKLSQKETHTHQIQQYIIGQLVESNQKNKDKNQALKQIILGLCDEVSLQQNSRNFIKNQIQQYFNDKPKQQKASLEDSTVTQQYLQKFITQIGELREKIQTLQQINQALNREKQELIQKGFISKINQNFQNPQLKLHKKEEDLLFKNNFSFQSCQQCSQYFEQIKVLKMKIKRLQDNLLKKDDVMQSMNQEFSQEICKYNRVFQRISQQNRQLKQYIDFQLYTIINKLQGELKELKTEKSKFQRDQEIYESNPYFQNENQYNLYNPKYTKPYKKYQKIQTTQYLPQNIFTRNNSKDYRQGTSNSRIRKNIPPTNRSKSKASQNSRPHSYKTYSPNSLIRKNYNAPDIRPQNHQRKANDDYEGY